MSFSCFRYFLIVVSYRIIKRLVENFLKNNVFSALQVFLGWLVRLGAGAAKKEARLPTNSAPRYALKEKLPFPAKNPFVLQISIMSRFWNKYHVICSDSSLISFLLVQSFLHLKHVAVESQKRTRQLCGSFFNTLARSSANRSPSAFLPFSLCYLPFIYSIVCLSSICP